MRRSRAVQTIAAVLVGLVIVQAIPFHAAVAFAQAPARRVALWRIDPLGLDAEIVGRLERLLRIEIERLTRGGLSTPDEVNRLIGPGRKFSSCEGENRCLAALGRALNVDAVVAGNVGGLGESYVINLKVVDARTGTELRRVAEPLAGSTAELIEGVRVAAYKLLAPERMRGSISVLTDIPKGEVLLDGRGIGKTPMPPIESVPVGEHKLRLRFPGAKDLERTVLVRFEKTSSVVVHLRELAPLPGATLQLGRPQAFYQKWWFWTAVGVVAAGIGVGVGLGLRQRPCDAPCQ